MKKRTGDKSTFPFLFTLSSCLVIFTFFQLLRADITPLSTIDDAIFAGKQQLFSRTVSGVSQAHQTFLAAKNAYDLSADRQQRIKLHAYLALTRLADVVARNEGSGSDSLRKLLAQYGINFTGDAFESMQMQIPVDSSNKTVLLPSSAPAGDTLRTFLAGPFLTALNASLADLNLVVSLLDAATESKEIIGKSLLDPQGQEPMLQDVEMDDGDYYLFRAFLKALKGYVLTLTAYNQDFDARELAALSNAHLFNIQNFLDQHPELLKVRADGPAALSAAKQSFIEAIDDYLIASENIRNDVDLQVGATELTILDESDLYREGLFRENLDKIKISLQQDTPVQLTDLRVSTEYYVYGGTSFSAMEPSWWEKGYHPDQYGYTFLGKASATATFEGSYSYYIITTKPGNLAPVDAVQGSNGIYYGTNFLTGNTDNRWNINGAPDGNYALVGEARGYGFVVIYPAAAITSLKVYLASVPGVAPREVYGKRINISSIFGNGTTAPPNLRDLLPQFSHFGLGEPVSGTMGQGLNNDPTLGGILPDNITQDSWQGEPFRPFGTITVPQVAITVDGTIADWNGLSPALTGVRDSIPADIDIAQLYLAKDNSYLYFRVDLAAGFNTQFRELTLRFRKLPGDTDPLIGDTRLRIRYQPSLQNKWQLFKGTYSGNNTWAESSDLGPGNVAGAGPSIEGRILLTTLGEIGGRFIGADTSSFYPGAADRNRTHLQIQPTAAITGILNIPNYSGADPIYIEVYPYAASLDRANLLGGQVIFPGEYTAGMTYRIDNLPLGEKILLHVHTDKDRNGIVTPGDNTAFYMLTTAAGSNSLNPANDNRFSFPPPALKESSVICRRNSPTGACTYYFSTSIAGPGSNDVTITVKGPWGNFILSPSKYRQQKGQNYNVATNPAYLPNGDYTFNAVDSLGRAATPVTYRYEFNGSLPLVDTAAFVPANRTFMGTTTPTLSWQPPAGGPYYYQVTVQDWPGTDIWFQSDIQTATSVTVPAGLLQPDTPYQWYVRLYDSAGHPMNAMQTANSYFHTGNGGTPTLESVSLTTRPPVGTQTNFSTSIIGRMTNVFPDEVKDFRLKDPSLQTSFTLPGTLGVNYSFTGMASYNRGYSTPSPPNPANYTIEIDYLRSGVLTTLAIANVPYEYHPVTAVDQASLAPANNHYFNTATPVLSWNPMHGNPDFSYRPAIIDSMNKWVVWRGSWTKDTSVTVPPGILERGRSYYWNLRTSSDYDPVRSSTTGSYTSYVDAPSDRPNFLFTINNSSTLKGDLNDDWRTDVLDAVLALQILAGNKQAAIRRDFPDSGADVGNNGKVGPEDVIYILQWTAGLR